MVGAILWAIGIISPEALMLLMQTDAKWIVLVLLSLDIARMVLEWRRGDGRYWFDR
jgi:hypothetical protein